MHHRIVDGGLGFSTPNGPRFRNGSRLMGGFGNHYESDDDEFNMTSVRYDHIPLTPGLSHAVRLELGSDPNVVLGPERRVSDADEEASSFTSTTDEESNATKCDGPAGIQPLYKAEPTSPMESKKPNQLRLQRKRDNPMFLYNTTRSKDVLQLQLAMQKQTEFDGENRDMDHRLHCIYKPQKKSTPEPPPPPPPPPSRKRSRSNSPVPKFIDLSSSSQQQGNKVRETPVRKLKPPPPAVAIASGNGSHPTTARGSPILLESYTRRPHKNKRATSKAKAERQVKKPKKATPRKASPSKGDEDDEDDSRFKRFQNTQWHEKFEELMKFRNSNGHCQVPHTWPPNPQLARWVKRQRYQFKLRCEGKLSTMTEDRVELLNEVGFVWDSHAAAWQEKYEELKDYVNTYKTFNMGNSYSTHPQLATWVKCQRRQYKLLMLGQESNMTNERKDLLEKLGFLWGVRNVGGKK